MSDINLLPEDLRSRETSAKAGGSESSVQKPRYSMPAGPNFAADKPVGENPPTDRQSWWQKLVGRHQVGKSSILPPVPPAAPPKNDNVLTKINLKHCHFLVVRQAALAEK